MTTAVASDKLCVYDVTLRVMIKKKKKTKNLAGCGGSRL